MKYFLVMLLGTVAMAGQFGAEADKSSVAAKAKLLMVRENPATGERLLFKADSVNATEVKSLVKSADQESESKLIAKIEALEKSEKPVLLASTADRSDSPTNAWWGYYYGSFYVTYVTFYYTSYYYIPWGGYYYYWLW